MQQAHDVFKRRYEVLLAYKWGSENSPTPDERQMAEDGLVLLAALGEAKKQLQAALAWLEGVTP